MKRSSVLVVGLVLLSSGSAPGGPASDPATDCADLDLVTYQAASAERLQRIEIARDVPREDAVAGLEAVRSPQGTARLLIARPDTSKPGPWATQIYAVGNAARPLRLSVRFHDHVHQVRTHWINEKLVHFQVWWGRLLATDVILDLETAKVLHAEDANHGLLVVPCAEKQPLRKQ